MALLSKLRRVTLPSHKEVFIKALQMTSGVEQTRVENYNILYKVIAFQGVKEGVGCSTLVASVAKALAMLKLHVCVIDTSILSPSQDTLLRTKEEKVSDWLDFNIGGASSVAVSAIDNRIGVLSFRNRGIIELLSAGDRGDLVTIALSQLQDKYDIILIDACHETTSVNMAALQASQKIIQIWDNSVLGLKSIASYLSNSAILSCSKDKMRHVVLNKILRDVPTDWGVLFKEYGFNELTRIPFSEVIAYSTAVGGTVVDFEATHEDIESFSLSVADIVTHLLDIENTTTMQKGYAASVERGEVEGTLHKKMRDKKEVNDAKGVVITKVEGFTPDGEPISQLNTVADYGVYHEGKLMGVGGNFSTPEGVIEEESKENEQKLIKNKQKKRGWFRKRGE